MSWPLVLLASNACFCSVSLLKDISRLSIYSGICEAKHCLSSLAADVRHKSTLHNTKTSATCMTCPSSKTHCSNRANRAYQALT